MKVLSKDAITREEVQELVSVAKEQHHKTTLWLVVAIVASFVINVALTVSLVAL